MIGLDLNQTIQRPTRTHTVDFVSVGLLATNPLRRATRAVAIDPTLTDRLDDLLRSVRA